MWKGCECDQDRLRERTVSDYGVKLDYNCTMAEFIGKENGIAPDEFDRAVARGVEPVEALDRMVGQGRGWHREEKMHRGTNRGRGSMATGDWTRTAFRRRLFYAAYLM